MYYINALYFEEGPLSPFQKGPENQKTQTQREELLLVENL